MKRFNLLLLLLTLLSSANTKAAIQLAFGTASQHGTTLELPLRVSGLSDYTAPALASYDLRIAFDSTHLSYLGTQFGDPLLGNQLDVFGLGLNSVAAELVMPGTLSLFEISLDSPQDLNALQADTFTLATLQFSLLNPGSSGLSIDILAFGNATGDPLRAVVTPTTIASVPLPAAAWLMLGGLRIVLRKRIH